MLKKVSENGKGVNSEDKERNQDRIPIKEVYYVPPLEGHG